MNNLTLQLSIVYLTLFILAVIPTALLFTENKKRSLISLAATVALAAVAYWFLGAFIEFGFNNIAHINTFIRWLHSKIPNVINHLDSISILLTLVATDAMSWFMFGALKTKKTEDDQIRGAIVKPFNAAKKAIEKAGVPKIPLTIGSIPIPTWLETRSIILFGMLGTGKTLAIIMLCKLFRNRGEGFIVHDANWDIFNQVGRKGDIVFSPSRTKLLNYSIFAEINNYDDIEIIVNAAIPEEQGENKFFYQQSRGFASDSLKKLWEKGMTTNKDVYHYLIKASPDEIKELLKDTPSAKLFLSGNEKVLSNILAIVSYHFRFLEFLKPSAGRTAFSFRKWLSNKKKGQSLFIPYVDNTAGQTESLRRFVIQILLLESLSLKPNKRRRIPFILDELASAGYLEGLDVAIARGRKYGLYFIIGCQNVSQIFAIYGKYKAQSILGCIGHWLLLRTPDQETGEYLSKTIGDREIEREQRSYNSGSNSVTTQYQRQIERLVLPSELSLLPDRHGYLSISGNGWTKVEIPIVNGDREEKQQTTVKKAQAKLNKPAVKPQLKGAKQPIRKPPQISQKTSKKPAKLASQQRKPAQKPVAKSTNNKPLDEV